MRSAKSTRCGDVYNPTRSSDCCNNNHRKPDVLPLLFVPAMRMLGVAKEGCSSAAKAAPTRSRPGLMRSWARRENNEAKAVFSILLTCLALEFPKVQKSVRAFHGDGRSYLTYHAQEGIL